MKTKKLILALTLLTVASPVLTMQQSNNLPPEWRRLFARARQQGNNNADPREFLSNITIMRGLRIVGFRNDSKAPVTLLRFDSKPAKTLRKNKYSAKESCIATSPQEMRIIKAGPFFFDENEIAVNQPAFFNIITQNKIAGMRINTSKNTISWKGKGNVKPFQPGDEMVMHIKEDGTVNLLSKREVALSLVQQNREKRLSKLLKGFTLPGREDLVLMRHLEKRIAHYAVQPTFNKQMIIDKLMDNTLEPRDIAKHINEILDYLGETKSSELCAALDLYFENRNNPQAKAAIFTILMKN